MNTRGFDLWLAGLFSILIVFAAACGAPPSTSETEGKPAPTKERPRPGAPAGVFVDAKALAGQPLPLFVEALGPVDGDEPVPATGEHEVTFRSGSVRVRFVDGHAVWMWVDEMHGVLLNKNTISRLGFSEARRFERGAGVVRWYELPGVETLVMQAEAGDSLRAESAEIHFETGLGASLSD